MNIRAYLYALSAVVLMAACSADDDARRTDGRTGTVCVGLRISTADGTTRATRATTWADDNATDQEMMNVWTVVVVSDDDDKVQAIHACKPSGGTRPEADDYVSLTPGTTYRFYSFANMAPSVAMQLLGISGTAATGSSVTRADGDPSADGQVSSPRDTIPAYTPLATDHFMAEATANTVYDIAFTPGATVSASAASAATATVGGNGFDPAAASNGFGATGIPMSNVQTKLIESATVFDLIVVRMMAKMELQLTNQTGNALTVSRITLSDVTQNTTDNLKLLPTLTRADDKAATARDVRPNLGTAATVGTYTVAPAVAIAQGAKQSVAFYVNESATPQNADQLFVLTLQTDGAAYRYALITDDASHSWNYIARNDYRQIPITIDDIQFELTPYDFPPIGVYPVSVKQLGDHLYDFQFHDYGHFHLLPRVTKGGTPVAFTATTPTGSGFTWGLVGNDIAQSWFTAATADATSWLDADGIKATGFYRDRSDTADGDEAGGLPLWYANSAGQPQWDPAGADNYQPFLFGYVAEPPAAWWSSPTDRRIYHEMKIQLYNGATPYRTALYRFYMTLSAQQMLAAPRHRNIPGPGTTHSRPWNKTYQPLEQPRGHGAR